MEEAPLLKQEISDLKLQHSLDEQEKALLNERLELEKERVKIERERTQIAKDREEAVKAALEVQRSMTSDYKTLLAEKDKEVKKAKTFGFIVGTVGAIIAILALAVAL